MHLLTVGQKWKLWWALLGVEMVAVPLLAIPYVLCSLVFVVISCFARSLFREPLKPFQFAAEILPFLRWTPRLFSGWRSQSSA